MVSPGDPERAADLARRAASVSHDGEAVYGAQVIAAMEALAFVEPDLDLLIDTALAQIPADSLIRRMVGEIREWHTVEPDWRKARERLARQFGYDTYGGNCHMIPNHGLIMLSLLWGEGDFSRSLMIVNTSGWDTDCNSGNVGCLLGIRNGLAGIDAGPDWRGPLADRFYLPTADPGRGITDAATEALHLVAVGRRLAGEKPARPKDGARFHFSLPGSVQGFVAADEAISVENRLGPGGARTLALRYSGLTTEPVRVMTPTFIPSRDTARYFERRGYALMAAPTLYPGQTLRAVVRADSSSSGPLRCALALGVYDAADEVAPHRGAEVTLEPGASHTFEWRVPDQAGYPIAEVGLELGGQAEGVVHLDSLDWNGAPEVTLTRTEGGEMWRRAWADGVDSFWTFPESYRLMQNQGTGLLIQGSREWRDYRMSADVTPHMVRSAGIAARVQGMRRFYALLLDRSGRLRLVKALDGESVLAECPLEWAFGQTFELALEVQGPSLRGFVDGTLTLEATDSDRPLESGALALVCEEGRTATQAVRVAPLG
jgi:hypothetical protein